jgi:Flp pilus assembly protein TadG
MPITNTSHNVFELSNPFENAVTAGVSQRIELPSGNIETRYFALGINSTTSYTGITLFVPIGQMTGTIDVYGYKLG